MPSAGSSTKPPASEPRTPPAVFARYSRPARRPTTTSVSWIMAFASGYVRPIISAGTPSSTATYFSTIHICIASPCHPGVSPKAWNALRRSAETVGSVTVAMPTTLKTTSRACAPMKSRYGRPKRLCSVPPIRDPSQMPTRMTVRMVDRTVRKPPKTALRWRNHTISSAMATKPETKTAAPTRRTARVWESTALLAAGTVLGTPGHVCCCFAIRSAPSPDSTLKKTAIICVPCRPTVGMKA